MAEEKQGFCLACRKRTSRVIWTSKDFVCSPECEDKLNFDDDWLFSQLVKRIISRKMRQFAEKAARKELRRLSNQRKEELR